MRSLVWMAHQKLFFFFQETNDFDIFKGDDDIDFVSVSSLM